MSASYEYDPATSTRMTDGALTPDPYGALCGTIAFSGGTLVVALIGRFYYATPLAEFIFIRGPFVGCHCSR